MNRQERTQQIAANDDPITERALIRHTKSVILSTGCFNEDLRAWDGRIPAHQTWIHFKTFFIDAFVSFLESPNYNGGETAGQAGYNGNHANAAQHYEKGTVDISMPGYVKKALQRFDHDPPTKPQDAPHLWTKPNYGAKQQMTEMDTSPSLDHSGIKRLQEVVGTPLHYGRAIDNTMLVALGTLASQQTKATEATGKALTQLLDCAATHPDAIV